MPVAQSRFLFTSVLFGFAIGSLNARSVADQMSWTWIAATATSTDLATDLATDASHSALVSRRVALVHAGKDYFAFVCMFFGPGLDIARIGALSSFRRR